MQLSNIINSCEDSLTRLEAYHDSHAGGKGANTSSAAWSARHMWNAYKNPNSDSDAIVSRELKARGIRSSGVVKRGVKENDYIGCGNSASTIGYNI